MSLAEQLSAYKENMVKNAPAEALKIMHRATADLRTSGIMDKVIKVGDTAPEFELPNAAEKVFRLQDFLAAGPLVLGFFRGRW